MAKIRNFMFILLICSYSSINSMNIFTHLFNRSDIRNEAAAEIARQKAIEEAAKIDALTDKIQKDRIEAFAKLIELTGYGIYYSGKGIYYFLNNTFKFGYKLFDKPERTFDHLTKGKTEVVVGCTGASLLTAAILYLIYKNNQRIENDRAAQLKKDKEYKEDAAASQARQKNLQEDQPGATYQPIQQLQDEGSPYYPVLPRREGY